MPVRQLRPTRAPPPAAEEELDLALLDALPEVAPKPPLPFPRAEAELETAEQELARLRVIVAELRDENTRLVRRLDLYERALEAYRALAADVEDALR